MLLLCFCNLVLARITKFWGLKRKNRKSMIQMWPPPPWGILPEALLDAMSTLLICPHKTFPISLLWSTLYYGYPLMFQGQNLFDLKKKLWSKTLNTLSGIEWHPSKYLMKKPVHYFINSCLLDLPHLLSFCLTLTLYARGVTHGSSRGSYRFECLLCIRHFSNYIIVFSLIPQGSIITCIHFLERLTNSIERQNYRENPERERGRETQASDTHKSSGWTRMNPESRSCTRVGPKYVAHCLHSSSENIRNPSSWLLKPVHFPPIYKQVY